MKKGCPRNTRSKPMKQKLHDKAFVPFVCLVGKPLLAMLSFAFTMMVQCDRDA